MTTVQSKVTDGQDLVPFFYLRITGLPFYIFATVNPNDSTRYGSFAWSAPTGFPSSTWAQRGLQLPDDQIDQKLTDIIGGIASPARCRLSVIDFPDPSHPGFKYFSRLFASGRALSDSSIPVGTLDNPISAVPLADTVMEVRGASVAWPTPSDTYVGTETIGINGVSNNGDGSFELTFAARNKYVCFGNSADGGTYWPPTPYHHIAYNSVGDANSGQSPTITGDIPDILGRTAALWMGHMRPDGNPEPETSSACLLLGRIGGVEVGKIGGMFDITIDSIMGDLTKALIAPDLPHATIQPGFYLYNSAWCTFYVQAAGRNIAISITPTLYQTPESLASAVTAALGANVDTNYISLQVIPSGDGTTVFAFVSNRVGSGFRFSTLASQVGSPVSALTSLLYALGFDPSVSYYQTDIDTTSQAPTISAPRPCAATFVPTLDAVNSNSLSLVEPWIAQGFFSNQGDGTGLAWARFGDGQIVRVISVTGGSGNAVTTGQVALGTAALTGADTSDTSYGKFYYVEIGQVATIDQVVMYLTFIQTPAPSFTRFLGRLLASTSGITADADLNVFPEGVGLGWSKLLTSAEWSITDDTMGRVAYVDSTTKFNDFFGSYAREHGLFLVWDPSAGGVRLRRFQVPTKAGATVSGTTTVSFTESNRAKVADRTSQRAYRDSLRTSWKIQPTYGWAGLGFTKSPPALVVNDVRARSQYPNDARQEAIEDKTLVAFPQLGDIIGQLLKLYGQPWTLCSRSMNKRGLLLAPGTIHQIVDNTLINPFTGASGITVGDAVYGVLTRVAANPATGDVTIEFVINSSDDQSLYRQWSPTALVDFNNNSGGYTHGYNSGTKTLSTVMKFGTDAAGDGSSSYWDVGDAVQVVTRDNSDDLSSSITTATIASVGSGLITLTIDIGSVSSASETIVILQKYNSATTARKTGATKVSWQGQGATRIIQTTASARLNKWV